MDNKRYLGWLGMMAAISAMGTSSHREMYYEPTETDQVKKLRLAQKEIKRHKANGLKEFVYGKNSLWSRDLKNADRKARNKGWL